MSISLKLSEQELPLDEQRDKKFVPRDKVCWNYRETWTRKARETFRYNVCSRGRSLGKGISRNQQQYDSLNHRPFLCLEMLRSSADRRIIKLSDWITFISARIKRDDMFDSFTKPTMKSASVSRRARLISNTMMIRKTRGVSTRSSKFMSMQFTTRSPLASSTGGRTTTIMVKFPSNGSH